MSEVKLISVINRTKRSFNWVRPGEVTQVNKHNLDAYIRFWFDILGDTINSVSEDPVKTAPKLTKTQIIEKLKEKGITVPSKANAEELLALLTESEKPTTENGGTEDYAKILTEAKIDFADGDDLKKLCEDNGLI